MDRDTLEQLEAARRRHADAVAERIRRVGALADATSVRKRFEREFGASLPAMVRVAERLCREADVLERVPAANRPREARDWLERARSAIDGATLGVIARYGHSTDPAADAAIAAAESLLAGAAAVMAGVGGLPAATEALEAARTAERLAAEELNQWLSQLPEPTAAVATLDSSFPVALFPVRLETRFFRYAEPVARPELPPQAGELRVRMYPDAILANLHEPRLTANERDAGTDYWRTAWRDGREEDAWSALVAEVGAARAGWIVRECQPVNLGDFPPSPGAAAPAPRFPPVETRPLNWHRSPAAHLLPDRWVVEAIPRVAVTSEERARYQVTSRPVREPLALSPGFDGERAAAEPIDGGNGPPLDPAIHWTFDFNRAEEVGMAVRIPLEARDLQDGFVRVSALGVKASMDPRQAAMELENLIASHRHSRGFAFVKQGTPTNNTASAGSGYPPDDPRGAESFRVERGAPLARNGGDGARFMAALGLPIAAADHLAGADRDEQRGARAMAIALWPATVGYYLQQMLASLPDLPAQPADLSDATVDAVRRHFVEFVRGRGPFPAFRVGSVPYGLLPVTTLEHVPATELGSSASLDERLPMILAELYRTLSAQAAQYAPRVGASGDPHADLLNLFRMDASSREVYVRPAVGEETVGNLGDYAGADVERFHEPIALDDTISLGGPGDPPPEALTLRTLLSFPASEPDRVDGYGNRAAGPGGSGGNG